MNIHVWLHLLHVHHGYMATATLQYCSSPGHSNPNKAQHCCWTHQSTQPQHSAHERSQLAATMLVKAPKQGSELLRANNHPPHRQQPPLLATPHTDRHCYGCAERHHIPPPPHTQSSAGHKAVQAPPWCQSSSWPPAMYCSSGNTRNARCTQPHTCCCRNEPLLLLLLLQASWRGPCLDI